MVIMQNIDNYVKKIYILVKIIGTKGEANGDFKLYGYSWNMQRMWKTHLRDEGNLSAGI